MHVFETRNKLKTDVKDSQSTQALWCVLIVPALMRWMQEDQKKFMVILSYIVNSSPALRPETLPLK